MPDCLVPLVLFFLITLVSLHAVSPLSQSPAVTHSIILTHLIHNLPLPLLSEALQTRRWLLYTMAPVFALLFT